MICLFKSRTFIQPDCHICPREPKSKMVEQNLILILKTCRDSSIIGKLKPVDRRERTNGETKLSTFFIGNILNKGVETKVEC